MVAIAWQELLEKVDNRTALFNNRGAAPEQLAALLATADALLECTAGAPLPLAASLQAAMGKGTEAPRSPEEPRGSCQASVGRQISGNPKLRRGIYVALTAWCAPSRLIASGFTLDRLSILLQLGLVPFSRLRHCITPCRHRVTRLRRGMARHGCEPRVLAPVL